MSGVSRFAVGHIENEAKQSGRKHFALCVRLERQRSATVERAVQKEVQRIQIGKLEALDAAGDESGEMLRDALASKVSLEDRVPARLERDDAHVGGVALVARPGVRDVEEPHFHESTSTFVRTTCLSMSAGQ